MGGKRGEMRLPSGVCSEGRLATAEKHEGGENPSDCRPRHDLFKWGAVFRYLPISKGGESEERRKERKEPHHTTYFITKSKKAFGWA